MEVNLDCNTSSAPGQTHKLPWGQTSGLTGSATSRGTLQETSKRARLARSTAFWKVEIQLAMLVRLGKYTKFPNYRCQAESTDHIYTTLTYVRLCGIDNLGVEQLQACFQGSQIPNYPSDNFRDAMSSRYKLNRKLQYYNFEVGNTI